MSLATSKINISRSNVIDITTYPRENRRTMHQSARKGGILPAGEIIIMIVSSSYSEAKTQVLLSLRVLLAEHLFSFGEGSILCAKVAHMLLCMHIAYTVHTPEVGM
jgi:hypothetical protein